MDVRQQLAATIRNGLIRPGADASYADGDDGGWMTVDWPSVTREVIVMDRRVTVVDTGPVPGDAPPLLFLHGLGGNWQNWLLNIPAFRATHRCVAPDLPGFGASEMPTWPITVSGYAAAMAELCETLGVRGPIVVGNSMGGFIGAELAIAFPTQVQRLVLVSAAGLSVENVRREPLLTLARAYAVNARWLGTRREVIVRRPRLRRAFLQTVVRYPERLSGPLTWELVEGAGKPGFLPALDALLSYSFGKRLREIEIPVLIVWGRNDMIVPVEDAEGFEQLIGPNARRVILEDTGHAAMIERPSRFNALLRDFASGQPAPERHVEGASR